MVELVEMRALTTWRNNQYEGHVEIGADIKVTEQRARELERSGFAVRKPALSGKTVQVHADPVELKRPFAR